MKVGICRRRDRDRRWNEPDWLPNIVVKFTAHFHVAIGYSAFTAATSKTRDDLGSMASHHRGYLEKLAHVVSRDALVSIVSHYRCHLKNVAHSASVAISC